MEQILLTKIYFLAKLLSIDLTIATNQLKTVFFNEKPSMSIFYWMFSWNIIICCFFLSSVCDTVNTVAFNRLTFREAACCWTD